MRSFRTSFWGVGAIMLLLVTISGCQDLTSGSDKLPTGVPDPKALDNPAGAMGQYQAAVCQFSQCTGTNNALMSVAVVGGILTDELQSNRLGTALDAGTWNNTTSELPLDARQVSGREDGVGTLAAPYISLHQVRRSARLAAAALWKHGAAFSPALRGHLFAIEGYAEVFLADLYCSGIPLSTVNFESDFTYVAGSTTAAVYAHAISLFDSALALSSDSVRILNFARIGKARALLARGAYAAAAEIAVTVPDGFAYQTIMQWTVVGTLGSFTSAKITVSDREGGTGFPYRTSRDPRTTVVRYGTNLTTRDTLWFPAKYGTQTSMSPMIVANATEARLIEAEAALQRNDISGWLTFLNRLRTDSTWTVRPNATDPMRVDTVWNAGTGGMAGLPPLQDPGIGLVDPARTDARINLLFAERAAWLFLTGHRQGDLRRLVRLPRDGGYGRAEEQVYPTGPYKGAPYLVEYGHDVDLVIPNTEYRNELFTGCQERGA